LKGKRRGGRGLRFNNDRPGRRRGRRGGGFFFYFSRDRKRERGKGPQIPSTSTSIRGQEEKRRGGLRAVLFPTLSPKGKRGIVRFSAYLYGKERENGV